MKISKIGLVSRYNHDFSGTNWASHLMAPAPVILNDKILRVYFGGWDSNKISRIRYLDLALDNPSRIMGFSKNAVLDIGDDGCFDENGVFPAHIYKFNNEKIFLYYTGFQLGHKIRHYNFGGLAISEDNGQSFKRVSRAPILDRSDEGLFVRAGQSIALANGGGLHVVYSAGSSWHLCQGELRPVYDVYYQKSSDGIALEKSGRKILSADLGIEHGLGRPQIVQMNGEYYIFYTRRIIEGMKYSFGCARSNDMVNWERLDHIFDDSFFGKKGEFDCNMVYFPAVVQVTAKKAYLFYSGNNFGEEGMGLMEIEL